ncbi:MAG: tetratricopeptide repeat protein [Pseudohongiellaceae bacterium]
MAKSRKQRKRRAAAQHNGNQLSQAAPAATDFGAAAEQKRAFADISQGINFLQPRILITLQFAALLLMVAASYLPAFTAGFLWDDNIFSDALPVREWGGLRDIWFNPGIIGSESHYWPVLYTSFWLEHKLWGFDATHSPWGFHTVNILLHGINTVLMWRLLLRMAVPGAWLIAAFFAVHPVHVEAVAWIIARKDLLATLFYLLAMFCWLRFRERPKNRRNSQPRIGLYLLMLLLYTAGVLSKTVAITLPAILLVWVWWQQGHIRGRDVMHVTPLFALALILGVLDLRFFAGRTLIEFDYYWWERLIIISKALWFYAEKLLWPHPLLFIYNNDWDLNPANLLNWLALPAALALAAALYLARHHIGRGPLAGALFFAITLSPMLGFFNNSYMKFAFVADRYQYLASAGLIIVLVGAAVFLSRQLVNNGMRWGAGALAAVLLLVCGVATYQRAEVYKDKIVLFTHVTDTHPDAFEGYYNFGTFLMSFDRQEEAVSAFYESIKHYPKLTKAYVNLGSALMELDRHEEAVDVLQRAIEEGPTAIEQEKDPQGVNYRTAAAYINLGSAQLELDRFEEAEGNLRHALGMEPESLQGYQNLAAVLLEQERKADALPVLEKIAELMPQPSVGPYRQMASIANELGRTRQADNYNLQAIALELGLDQEHPQVLGQLAAVYFNEGRYEQALTLFQRIVQMEPNNADAHSNLGSALAQTGRLEEAIASFERALVLQPQLESALTNMELARQRLNQGN